VSAQLPRLRQAVIAAGDLDAVAGRLRAELGLNEPFADEGVGYFGLHNAVFAAADTFLEVVSPTRDGTAAGRLIERRGGDCGYMLMLQVDDVAAARDRARAAGVREVFEVTLPDIDEVHLHPADMRGAIVSVSAPQPPGAWRWGGPDWEQRAAPVQVVGATVAVADPDAVAARWREIAGGLGGIRFVQDDAERGLVEITVSDGGRDPVEIGGVRFVFADRRRDD
jgi:Glyoxalase-like domain